MLNHTQLSNHFWRYEYACKCGCGFSTVDAELIWVMEEARSDLGSHVITILSGCRCPTHNKNEGGADDSYHMKGKANDFVVRSIAPVAVYEYLNRRYPNHYGIGLYKTFVHFDVRSKMARWKMI